MTARTLPATQRLTAQRGPLPAQVSTRLRQLWHDEPRLVWFALAMLAAMVPAAIGLGLDERVLRGVNVWVKPLKFMAAVALLALTTAWFAGQLPAAVRRPALTPRSCGR